MAKIWGRSSKGSPIKRSFDKIIDNFGHKVLYRRYNVGVESKYYEAATGDSKGGAKWTYTDEIIEGEVYLNLHTAQPQDIEHVAGILQLGENNINLPPHQETT